jgi:hypothetical protein
MKCWPCQNTKIAGISGSTKLIDVGGSKLKRLVQPDQPQILGRQHAERTLNPWAAQQIAKKRFNAWTLCLDPDRAAGAVDDEVAHLGVVDSHLRLGLPGRVGGGIVGKHADDFDLVEVLEGVCSRSVNSPPMTR